MRDNEKQCTLFCCFWREERAKRKLSTVLGDLSSVTTLPPSVQQYGIPVSVANNDAARKVC